MLKKVALSLLIGAAVGSTLYAGDNEGISTGDRILGIEVGGSTIKADTNFSPVNDIAEYGHESTDVEFGLRLGAEKEDWRTLLVANYFDNSDDDQKYWKGLLEIDYYLTNASGLKPYIGLNVGYMNYESTNIDESGLIYGGQAGVQYRVVENIEIDLMYRYSIGDIDQVDNIGSFIFGLSYVF